MHRSLNCNFETSCSQTALIRRTSFQLDGNYRVLNLQLSNFFGGFLLLDIPILAAVLWPSHRAIENWLQSNNSTGFGPFRRLPPHAYPAHTYGGLACAMPEILPRHSRRRPEMGRSQSREGGAQSSDEGDIVMQRCTRQIGRIIFVALARSSVETSVETLASEI